MILDMRLRQCRSHAVAKGNQGQSGIGGARDIGELLDIGGHVVPGRHAELSQAREAGRLSMPAQIQGVHDTSARRKESGQSVIPGAVFGNAVGNLDAGTRLDATWRLPGAVPDHHLVYVGMERG
ncbi:Uncharacterised protein [Mycobacteroides abscessus subsp. massiliense]|nr:Uncharacterised protein [Mycobacteroides abscessus subsp. massiliense]